MTNTKFRHLDLFSGIGGFALAASWVWGEQHEIVSFCEIEKFPQKVLKKHWPDVPIHDDIKTLRGDQYGRIDLVSGGFPCQPYSVAGKQLGKEDNRALWPEMLRIIKEAKPSWVIGENVAGFISMGLDGCFSDLEGEGYETTAFIIPACAVNAPHRRDRIWIVANRKVRGRDDSPIKKPGKYQGTQGQGGRFHLTNFNTNSPGCKTSRPSLSPGWEKKRSMFGYTDERFKWDGWPLTEPPVCGADDGIPNRVDRIKGCGNAIVPQAVVPVMESIKQIEEMNYETIRI